MNKPTIFLDLDGVLNSTTTGFLNGFADRSMDLELDDYSVQILNMLLTSIPNHQIVVSSSWRKIDPNIFQTLIDYGVKGNFIDVTPSLNNCFFRGDEVQAWLNDHPEVTTFVCIDDGDDFHSNHNLILTNPLYGIRLIDLYQTLKVLDPLADTLLHRELQQEFLSIPIKYREV